jgi:very-short-patch-repair endonuclease
MSRKTKFARELRRNSTDAERLLWRHLRARRLAGHKFKRQCPVGKYIVDFVCWETKLIVELDGGQHADNALDIERDEYLAAEGFKVLRIWNPEVFNNTAGVLERIWAFILELSHEEPSPAASARDLSQSHSDRREVRCPLTRR